MPLDERPLKGKKEGPVEGSGENPEPQEDKPEAPEGEQKEEKNGNGHAKDKKLSKDFKDRWERLEREDKEKQSPEQKAPGLGLFKQKMGDRKGAKSQMGFLAPALSDAAKKARSKAKREMFKRMEDTEPPQTKGPAPPEKQVPVKEQETIHTPLELKLEKKAIALEKQVDTLDKIMADLKGHRTGFIKKRQEELKKEAERPKISTEPHLSKLKVIKEEMEKKRTAEAGPDLFGIGFKKQDIQAQAEALPKQEAMKSALKASMDKTVRKGSIIKRLEEVLDSPMGIIQAESAEAKQRLLDEVSLLDTRGFEGRVKKLLSKIDKGKVFQAEGDLLNLKIAMEAQRSREQLKREREERLESHLQTMGSQSQDLEDVLSRHVKALEVEMDQTRARVIRDVKRLETTGFEHVVGKINDMLEDGRAFDAEEQLLELRLALKARALRDELKTLRGDRLTQKAHEVMPTLPPHTAAARTEPLSEEVPPVWSEKDLLEEIEEGEKEEPALLAEVQCGVCGTIISSGTNTCPACGNSFLTAQDLEKAEEKEPPLAELEPVSEEEASEEPSVSTILPPFHPPPEPPKPPEPPELLEIQCGVCGSIVPIGAKRCRACGTLLTSTGAVEILEEPLVEVGEPEAFPSLAPIEEAEPFPELVPVEEEESFLGLAPIEEEEGFPELVPIEEEESFPVLAPTDEEEPYPEVIPGKGIRCPSCQAFSPIDSISCISCGNQLSLPLLEPVEEDGVAELVPIGPDEEVTEELAPLEESEGIAELVEPEEVTGVQELEAEGVLEQEVEALEDAEAIPWTEPPAELEKELEWRRLCVRAKRFFNEGRVKAALESYDDAIEIKPTFTAYFGKGEALMSLGWTNSALDCFNQALEIDEEQLKGWVHKARVLETLGRYNEAIDSVNRAIAIDEEDQDAWHLKGSMLMQMGRTEEALAALDHYVGIRPSPEALRQAVEITQKAMAKAASGEPSVEVKTETPEDELAAVEEKELGSLRAGSRARRYRTLAKQRGLTNGFALVNGRGMTNGKSLVNGRFSLVNGRSKVNGIKGVTNGLGKGLINGRGLVNGASGLVNGRAVRDAHEGVPVIRFKRGQRTRAMQVAGGLAIVALLLIIPFASIYMFPSPSGIVVDGQFQDWGGVPMYDDSIVDQQANMDVDLTQYSMSISSKSISFLVKVPSGNQVMGGSGMGVDVLHVFLDTDGSDSTGYSIQGIGADVMLEAYGWDGKVQSSSLSKFNTSGTRDQEDWNGWIPGPSIKAISKGNQLEMQVATGDIGAFSTQNLLSLVHLSDMSGNQDISDSILTKARGTLTVSYQYINEQIVQPGTSTNPFMQLNMTAKKTPIEFQYLSLKRVGRMSDPQELGTVRLWADIDSNGQFNPTSDQQIASGTFGGQGAGQGEVLLQPAAPLELQPDTRSIYFVTIDVPGIVGTQQTLGIDIARSAIKIKQGAVTLNKMRPSLSYIGGPSSFITIDGDFEDWANVPSLTDPAQDTGVLSIPRIDLKEYRSNFDTQYVSFYLSTRGEIMSGLIVPDTDKTRPPTTPPNQTNITPGPPGPPVVLPRMTGADLAIIYLDSDQDPTTGYSFLGVSFGADFMIMVEGKAGDIITSSIYQYIKTAGASPWTELKVAVPAANDRFRLETQVSRTTLGIDPYQRVDAFFVMSDWDDNLDTSDTVLSGNRGELQSSSIDVIPDTILLGSADVPLFGLELQSTEDVILRQITYTRFGNTTDLDTGILNIYQDTGDRIFNALDTVTSLSDGQFIQSTAQMTLDRPLLLQGGVETILYLAADFTMLGDDHTIGVTLDRSSITSTAVEIRGQFPMSTYLAIVASEDDRGTEDTVNYTNGRIDRDWNGADEGDITDPDERNVIDSRDIRRARVSDNGTWLNFMVRTESNLNTNVHIYIDVDDDGTADYDLIYDNTNGDVLLYSYDGANWNQVAITDIDRYDQVRRTLEMGIEFSYLNLASGQTINYYVTTEADTSPGGNVQDRGPNNGWSDDYVTIPEFQDIIVPLLGSIVLISLIRYNRSRRRTRHCKGRRASSRTSRRVRRLIA